MVTIQADGCHHRVLNEQLRAVKGDVCLTGVCGQRFIATGFSDGQIDIYGIPGNALGACLNGAQITVHGNAQDAVGDTMNSGTITVHGSIGDAAGYAMRGGALYVKGNAGYRAGIHMKEYKEKRPVIVIGGKCGSFLGEYQAGGIIVVLGLSDDDRPIVSNFPFTGMHGGRVYLRAEVGDIDYPANVTAAPVDDGDREELRTLLAGACEAFGFDLESIMDAPFTKVVPDSRNPYKQMYAAN